MLSRGPTAALDSDAVALDTSFSAADILNKFEAAAASIRQ